MVKLTQVGFKLRKFESLSTHVILSTTPQFLLFICLSHYNNDTENLFFFFFFLILLSFLSTLSIFSRKLEWVIRTKSRELFILILLLSTKSALHFHLWSLKKIIYVIYKYVIYNLLIRHIFSFLSTASKLTLSL